MRTIFLFITLLAIGIPCFSQSTFLEIDGKVSVEAENWTDNIGAWEEVEGRNAYPIEKSGIGTFRARTIQITDEDQILGSLNGTIKLSEDPVSVPLCHPLSSASIIAPATSPDGFAHIFFYDEGDELVGYQAPAKRLVLPGLTVNSGKQARKLFGKLAKLTVGNEKGNCLLVSNNTTFNANDQVIKQELQKAGFTVQIASDEEVNAEEAYGKILVVISESVASAPLKETFKYTAVPLLICEPYILDGMGMIDAALQWHATPGQIGNAVMNRFGGSTEYLKYSIYFSEPGTYTTWMLAKGGGYKNTNHMKYSWNEPKPSSKIELNTELQWLKAKELLVVSDPGWQNLYVANGNKKDTNATTRYPNSRLDKLYVTRHEDTPGGDGPLQTLNCQQVKVPEDISGSNHEFLPKQVWHMTEGYVVIEAEDIDHFDGWVLKSDPKGFTGTGYLSWEGRDRTTSIEGLGGNDDELFVRIGPQEEWLIIRVMVEEAGEYLVNARNIHEREDGDNDAWVTLVNFRPYHVGAADTKVRRMGDSFKDGEGFTWLDWGVRNLYLEEGINDILIGGRSIGFGIDRIAVYKSNDKNAEVNALDINTSPSNQFR